MQVPNARGQKTGEEAFWGAVCSQTVCGIHPQQAGHLEARQEHGPIGDHIPIVHRHESHLALCFSSRVCDFVDACLGDFHRPLLDFEEPWGAHRSLD